MPRHHQRSCPVCGSRLVTGPLRCEHCAWHLVTRAEWKQLPPFSQGHAFYMQSSWPTSELAGAKNPHAEGTPAWTAFRRGEDRAVLDAQDSEE
jgi:hypothetical protein